MAPSEGRTIRAPRARRYLALWLPFLSAERLRRKARSPTAGANRMMRRSSSSRKNAARCASTRSIERRGRARPDAGHDAGRCQARASHLAVVEADPTADERLMLAARAPFATVHAARRARSALRPHARRRPAARICSAARRGFGPAILQRDGAPRPSPAGRRRRNAGRRARAGAFRRRRVAPPGEDGKFRLARFRRRARSADRDSVALTRAGLDDTGRSRRSLLAPR